MGPEGLAASAPLLLAAVLLDASFGDPVYPFHPVRLIGRSLTVLEKFLRRTGLGGYAGGVLLFLLLSLIWVVLPSLAALQAGMAVHVFLLYSSLAMRDLLDHAWVIQNACRREDLIAARSAVGRMVGRDTQNLDFAGCRRAAIESVAENFVDGFLGPLFWYVLGGLPGILIFKVVSTMDSMVGYKTAQYLRFGWSGARIDDLLNYVPARLAWFLLGLSACFFPTLSAIKGWRIGMKHHTLLPGPNPGWSEATMAGLLQRRLIGPIYKDGALVTSVWIGDPSDPQGGKDSDLTMAIQISLTAAMISVASGLFVMWP